MIFDGPRAFYESPLQGFWALLLVPAIWLLVRILRGRSPGDGVEPAAARFVDAFAVVFAVQTLLDPIVTGPVARALPAPWPTALSLLFVLLGDFRVFLLVAFLAGGRNRLKPALGEAAALTPIVPIFAWLAERALAAALGPLPGQALWLVHEATFLVLLLWLRGRVAAREPDAEAPRARYLRAVLLYAGAYYALWALCDVGILLGFEPAYAVRALPNQLYYAFFVPFAHARFFAASYSATRAFAQASR
jgi:hypothetical protein